MLRHRLRIAAVLGAALVLLPGCAVLSLRAKLWPWKKKKAPRATLKVDQLVGTITMVNEESSFVLIDGGTLPAPAVGEVLKTRAADGAPVQLRVTQIRKPPFYVADFVKGIPKQGEEVYQ